MAKFVEIVKKSFYEKYRSSVKEAQVSIEERIHGRKSNKDTCS